MYKAHISDLGAVQTGRNRYRRESMCLDFNSGFDKAAKHFILHFGDLTMTLEPNSLAVMGFDIYAPQESWRVQHDLHVPNISKSGFLQVSAEFDENGIATEKLVPQITCNPARTVVKIIIGDVAGDCCAARFSEDCVCEIGPEGNLRAIFMDNLIVTDD